MKEYKVTGMTCCHCESTVRNIAMKHGAGADAIVDKATGQVKFNVDDTFVEKDFVAAVEDAGYDIEVVTPAENLADIPKKVTNSW